MNRFYEIVFGLMALYSGFHLTKALVTGQAKLYRHRDPSRRGTKDYWIFVGTMAAGLIVMSFLLVFSLENAT